MLDIRLIREHPEIVENDLKKRGDIEKGKMLHELIKLDREMRTHIQKFQKLKQEKNTLTKEIKSKPSKSQTDTIKKINNEIKKHDGEIISLSERTTTILMKLPNILHESVPVGLDDMENVEIRHHGDKREKTESHIDVAQRLDLVDMERAAKISGARFYFLKNELVKLNRAVLDLAIDICIKKGYTPIHPPFMMRRKPYEGVTDISDFENVMYKIEKEDLYMIATSEHPMIGQYIDETLTDLPIKLVGVSPCFRTEAGSHGKDTKGIFRVHQFDKVEQIIICKPEDSWKYHEELIKNAEEIFQALELSYRVVNVCTGDMGTVAAKKYDLEAFMPAQQCYREMVSCSNCTDYQARRLNIKYREKDGAASIGLVHTLNCTAVASPRVLAAILETHQKNNVVHIPKALQKYTGFDKIERK